MIELRWIASSSTSALYVAAALARGSEIVDPRIAPAIAAPGCQLRDSVAEVIAPAGFFHHLVPLSAGIESNRELVGLALRKTAGRAFDEQVINRLAAEVGAVEQAFRTLLPDAVAELELRSAPPREQWEARGPGLLAAIGRMTARELVPERADVLLVHPVLGGGGEAYLPYNSVTLEAMLANPLAELPEIVRLAWLLSTLQLDLPRYSEEIPRQRLDRLAGLAMLPAALAAAEYVELARNDDRTLRQALTAWRLAESAQETEAMAQALGNWWQTFRNSPTSWRVALAALDQLLPAE